MPHFNILRVEETFKAEEPASPIIWIEEFHFTTDATILHIGDLHSSGYVPHHFEKNVMKTNIFTVVKSR